MVKGNKTMTDDPEGWCLPIEGIYGNRFDTFYVNGIGEIFQILSPDFPPGQEYKRLDELPENAKGLHDSITWDIEIPIEIVSDWYV